MLIFNPKFLLIYIIISTSYFLIKLFKLWLFIKISFEFCFNLQNFLKALSNEQFLSFLDDKNVSLI